MSDGLSWLPGIWPASNHDIRSPRGVAQLQCWLLASTASTACKTKSAPMEPVGNTCNSQPLPFKDPDCRSTLPDIHTIWMNHTQLLKNQYFNFLTFPTNTCMLKIAVRSRNGFTLWQGFFSALIFEGFLLEVSVRGQNCTFASFLYG